jgi:hypothetical protein
MPLSIGMTLVLARNNAGTQLIEKFADLLGGAVQFDGFGVNYVIATGIENIIGSPGDNTFKFHGDAKLDGYVAVGDGGKIKFDYSAYTSTASNTIGGKTYDGVVIDGSAGLAYGIPGTEAPLPVLGTFPGVNVNWGRASGVGGSRLAGLDLWAPSSALGSFAPEYNAVDGLGSVVGSPQTDYLKGNDDKNTFELGQGGNDTVIGGEEDDTVSFEAADQRMVIDLASGLAHSSIVAGTLSFTGGTLTIDADAGLFTLTHAGQTTSRLTFDATAEAIQFALEELSTLNAGDVTVTSTATPGKFTVSFDSGVAVTTLTGSADPGSNDGAGLVKFTVSGTAGFAAGTLTIVAIKGQFTLTHGGQTTTLLDFDATAAAIQSALEGLSTLDPGDVTVTSSGTPGVFAITFAGSVADPTLTTDVDPGSTGIGLKKFAAATSIVTLSGIEAVQGTKFNDVLFGDDEGNTFIFTDESGKNLVYGGGGDDVLDFTKVTEDIVESKMGKARVFTFGDNIVTAFGTFQVKKAGSKSSGFVSEVFGKKLLGGELELANGGTANSGTTITVTDATTLGVEALARWNALLPAKFQLSSSSIVFAVSDLAATNPLALGDTTYNSTTKVYTITVDNNAAGAGWYVDSAFTGATADSEFVSSPPNGIDLLTVLMHEIGHVAGIEHPDVPDSTSIMNEALRKGVRLNPTEELALSGISAQDKLAVGLDTFGDWAIGLGTKIDDFLTNATTIPFTDISLVSMLGVDVANFGTVVNTEVDKIGVAITTYFGTATTPNTNDMLLALQSLPGIHISSAPGTQEYSVSIDLATYSKSIVLDLSSLSLDLSDYGIDVELPFNLGLSTTQSQPLQLDASIHLDFAFGIDNSGQFYVLDPSIGASVAFGEIRQDIVGVDTTAKSFSVAGDQTTPNGQLNSANGHFVAGDRIAVSGSTGNNEIYTVVSATYDVYSDTTTIVVSEDVASDIADGALIKTMDFGITLGPLGLQSNDAVLSIGLSAGLGLNHKLTQDELETGGDAYTLLTSLTASMSEDSQYTIVLPISWNGLLAGVNDGVGFITATSALVQPGGSIAAFLTSVPSSIQITGMSDLLKFSGLSLDTILAALEDTADDLIGTDTEVLGAIVGGAVDATTGEFTGGQLKVYKEIWNTGTKLTSGFTPTLTATVQNSKVVEDTNGNKLRLLEWTVAAGTVWGLELATGPNDSELQQYEISEYKLLATYAADDVAINLLTADVQTSVTLRDGATTASGNLSNFRLRDGELYNDIPMLGVSLADMLGNGAISFAAGFGDAIHTVRDSARNIGELQDQLNAELRSFFGLPNTVNLVTLSYNNGAFDFDLDLEQAITRTYNLELDIEQLNLQQWLGFDPSQFLDISLTAPVNVAANVDLHIGFGFDLSNVFEPSFYVDADTGVTAHASGVAPDIDAKLSIDLPAIGPVDLPALGLNIIDGSAHIQADFYANLGDPAADSDGDGRISPLSIGAAFQAELSGSAAVDLPVFFPTASMPLGGTTQDLDGNGVADNALHAEAAFSIDQNFTLQTSYSYSLPNVSMNFDAVQAFIAYIDNAQNVLSGMEGFFSGIDKVADGIDSISLPIIGGSAFDSFANALRDIRSSVLGTKTGTNYADGSFGKWLQDQGSNSIIDSVLNEIRQALFDGFDSLNDSTGAKTNGVGGALFAFVVPDLDEFGAKQYDANGKMVVKIPTSANDIQVDFTANGLLTFNLMFGGTLVDGELPIDFSAGIPGVSLEVDAKLQAHIDYLMGIGLGIGNVSKTACHRLDSSLTPKVSTRRVKNWPWMFPLNSRTGPQRQGHSAS